MIIWVGRTVVHGEGWYGEAAGSIVIQDMLSKGSGEHVLWSPDGGGKNHLRCGGSPERRVHGQYWWGEAPSPVRHILVSWHWRSLVPAGFSAHLTLCNTDGPVGSARWPFSRLSFYGVWGW